MQKEEVGGEQRTRDQARQAALFSLMGRSEEHTLITVRLHDGRAALTLRPMEGEGRRGFLDFRPVGCS